MYKINPNSYSSVFVLPAEIADKHLRMAGKAQLKVLLWLFRNPSEGGDIARISRDTGIPTDEIDDAMLYWMEAGIIIKDDGGQQNFSDRGQISAFGIDLDEKQNDNNDNDNTDYEKEMQADRSVIDTPAETTKKNERIPVVKPSIKDISDRMAQSEEIRDMFGEIQRLFGRTMGYDGQSSLLMLHDYYGLPTEVIVMICAYAKNIGKQNSLSYIMKIGESWAENEINTFELASAKIARLENSDKAWNELKQMTGMENPRPTVKQSEFLEVWINDYGFGTDMIYLAYERAVEKKGNISFSYMNGILRAWHEKNYKTTEDVENAEREYAEALNAKRQKKENKSKNNSNGRVNRADEQLPPPSYDIELALKHSLMLDPTKTKRGQ
ncbi:MAG: DnaD domain protein [Clostridiales bacterium]|nr:DnaD domain protein [Clostridiales bacterium]